MNHDSEKSKDSAVIDRYLETVRDVDPQHLARLRERLAATPHPRKRYRRLTFALPPAAIPALVTAVALIVGSFAVIQHNQNRATAGHTSGAGTGGTILFANRNHWYTMAPNGSNRRMLLSNTAGCADFGCAAFSPDGTQLMVAAHTPDKKRITIAIVNTNGTGYHRLPLPDRTLNIEPGIWLPQGNRIAVHGWDNTNKKRDGIYELNPSAGSGFRRLTTSPDGHDEYPLAFSPDGSRLLVFHDHPVPNQGGFGDLLVMSADATGAVQLNPSDSRVWRAFGSPASWSPDGKQVAFTAFAMPVDSASAVFVANTDGTHRRRITDWNVYSTSARWSPNSNWILFDKAVPGDTLHNLFIVHPNGKGMKAVTSDAMGAGCCAIWSPTGTKLLWGQYHGSLVTMNLNGSGLKKLMPVDANHETAEFDWGR